MARATRRKASRQYCACFCKVVQILLTRSYAVTKHLGAGFGIDEAPIAAKSKLALIAAQQLHAQHFASRGSEPLDQTHGSVIEIVR